ncbi:MAG: NADH-quinone oxidoreductase subunit NuoF [Candidatus Aminicenantia bacterium]
MLEKVLTKNLEVENLSNIEVYLKYNGYQALKKAIFKMTPEQILQEVKKANLRGRGGAGFPAGVKWSFVPQKTDKPKYLCVNADEGEPGTFKDRLIMLKNPHLLIEGIVIASYCVGINTAYIYIRGEYEHIALKLEQAIKEAYQKKFLGKNILGSKFNLDLYLHRGAGAYICGEETALLESLEGKRGYPRLKPPFPASIGLFQAPTVINNVETLSNIPSIILRGGQWFTQQGLPKDGGTKLFAVSGSVKKPGVYELPIGTNLKEIIFDYAGGLKEGKELKAVIPGGLSAPILTPEEVEISMDFDSLLAVDSMLGSAAIIVIDKETPIIEILKIVTKFYAHESCGQCTPCRGGTWWMDKMVGRICQGKGRKNDVDNLIRIANNIWGMTLCPLGDAAAMAVRAIINKFREEIEEFIRKD